VVLPIDWATMVIVPATGSEALIVNGMRSPFSCSRRMMNCPGFLLVRDARRLDDELLDFEATLRASTILYMALLHNIQS